MSTYSTGSKILHWSIALIVIAMLSFSFFLDGIPKVYKPTAYMMHKSFGLTVLFLMFLRVLWLVYKGKPSLPNTVPVWQRILARTVQNALYFFLFAMPLSGWIMSVAANKAPQFFGLFKATLPISPDKQLAGLMNQTHFYVAWILIALIVLHISGAIKHFFIDKDDVVQTMLPMKKSL